MRQIRVKQQNKDARVSEGTYSHKAINAYLDHATTYLAGKTISVYRDGLIKFATYLESVQVDWSGFGQEHLDGFVAGLVKDGLSPSSVRVYIASAMGFLRWMIATKRLNGVSLVSPRRPKLVHRTGHTMTGTEFGRAITAFLTLDEPCRTALVVLACTGMRISEVTELGLDDITNSKRHGLIFFKFIGKKNNKERRVPMLRAGNGVLRDYLIHWRAQAARIQKHDPGRWLFPSPIHSNKPVSYKWLYNTMYTTLTKAGFTKGWYSPHSLRRTYLTLMRRSGVDPFLLKEIAGHADMQTTSIYIDIRDEDLAGAVERVNI